MTASAAIAIAAVGILAGALIGFWLPPHGRRPRRNQPQTVRRILLPFTGQAISRRAFEAAVRLAKAEGATLMPAYLARVPRQMPIDSPLPAQCEDAMSVLEAIEQRAISQGVAVDSRVGRGRTYRDALRRLLDSEKFDRVIVSATESASVGLSADDLEWLLTKVPSEILILRPAPDDTQRISSASLAGHF